MLAATNEQLNTKLAGIELAREELGIAARVAAEKQDAAEVWVAAGKEHW